MIIDIINSKKIYQNPNGGRTERIDAHFVERHVIFKDLDGKAYKETFTREEIPVDADITTIENKVKEKIRSKENIDESKFE